MTERASIANAAAAVVFGANAALAGAIWRFGPAGPLPMHFNINGVADGFGDRNELALLALGVTGVMALAWLALEAMRQRAERPAGLMWAQIVVLIVSGLIGALHAGLAFGAGANIGVADAPAAKLAGLSLLMLGAGALLGKVAPNPFVGVRTFWSLQSRLAWEKSNRLGGRLMFWIGLVGLCAAPVAPEPLGMQSLVAAVLLAAAASIFESWRVWRTDPDRAAV